jgi:hypothetical protein
VDLGHDEPPHDRGGRSPARLVLEVRQAGRPDALALPVMRAGNSWRYHRRPAPDHSGTALNKAADYLREHFGRLDPPPVEVVRPRQGKVGLPRHQGRCSAPIHSYNSSR